MPSQLVKNENRIQNSTQDIKNIEKIFKREVSSEFSRRHMERGIPLAGTIRDSISFFEPTNEIS